MSEAIHFAATVDGRTDHAAAACGRHKDRGRRYVTGVHTTTNALAVDCGSCQRGHAFKVAHAAAVAQLEAARPVLPVFEVGAAVTAFGAAAVVVQPRFGCPRDEVTIRWVGGRDDGRTTTVDPRRLTPR